MEVALYRLRANLSTIRGYLLSGNLHQAPNSKCISRVIVKRPMPMQYTSTRTIGTGLYTMSKRREKSRVGTDSLQIQNEDFFGLEQNSDDGVVIVDHTDACIDPLTKYSNEEPKVELILDKENIQLMNYGSIRFDRDNEATVFENNYKDSLISDDQMINESELQHMNYIDKQFFFGDRLVTNRSEDFSLEDRHNRGQKASYRKQSQQNESTLNEKSTERANITHNIVNANQLTPNFSGINAPTPNLEISADYVPSNFIEDQYFANRQQVTSQILTDLQTERPSVSESPSTQSEGNGNYSNHEAKKKFKGGEEEIVMQRKQEVEQTVKPNEKNPQTAYDYVMKLREAARISSPYDLTKKNEEFGNLNDCIAGMKYKLDSKGFRTYEDCIQDLDDQPEMFVLELLKKSILYNNHDILAINKPYGLQCHHGKGHHHKLTNYLPDLAKYVFQRTPISASAGHQKLYTVHRLDLDTTGVLILAKTQEMAQKLHDLMVERKIQKIYWALTKGVPSPIEGVVDIPIAEGMVEGKARMVLRPERNDETCSVIPKYSGKTHSAVTEYRLLAKHGNAALVELKPTTGFKHQLRAHLAFALGCPIIGDHKYSHISKLAPQKLPADVLNHLSMRQSKVRYLPMNLHACRVIVPGVLNGRDLHIRAHLPPHFVDIMRKLDIHMMK